MSMSESVLKALMRLFAIITQIHSEQKLSQARGIVESYLRQLLNPSKVNQYLIMFDFYHSSLREREVKTGEKQMSLFSVKSIIICENINKALDKKQKLLILMQILEILNLKEITNEEDIDFIRTIASAFKFDETVFSNCKSFILNSLYEVPDKSNLLLIDSRIESSYEGIKHLYREYLKGKLIFLYIETANTYLFRNIDADDQLYYKGKEIVPYRTFYLEKGATIKSPLIGTIYYSDIVKEFLRDKTPFKINFSAEKVGFRFTNSLNGIKSFTIYEESGTMVGIMGGSGVGKSTLLNLLNGSLKPKTGRILINGYDLHKEGRHLRGIIGYIPQDDLLIEDLTVYQNLYYNARLCFKDLNENEIIQHVHKVLTDLDLFEIRNLKVGNPLKKYISGGQRKRLNIALELIREPFIMFVDEPTSGLSSSDSDTVIDLLKEQSHKGKLVFVNIHQPSSDIFKRFDKLLIMDRGGKVIFYGNPLDALVYFKTENQLINAEDSECPTCGNVNPEQVLQIVEEKKVSEYGDVIDERQVSPEEWYERYKKKHEPPINLGAEIKSDLPVNDFKIPGKWMQFKIFSIRNLISKIIDKQYLLINLLEAPLLAFILGWFTRYNAGTPEDPGKYIFSENVNLPVYIFMSVIVALFLGMMVSAEEIIRDRKILLRESYLHLSKMSYYNSKIVFLMLLSAIQMAIYVWIGNSILQIKGMFIQYWLMLFLVALVANILGLNISASMRSVVSIYILIPLLLVPQIILGGAMIHFEKLNSQLSNPRYVPVVGDIMPSRWAYEALAVHQFKNNAYQQQLFAWDKQASDAAYTINYLIPELQLKLANVEKDIKINNDYLRATDNLELLRTEIIKLSSQINGADISFISQLTPSDFSISVLNRTKKFLEKARKTFSRSLDHSIEEKDKQLRSMSITLGGNNALIEFKQKHHNSGLEEILLNKRDPLKILQFDNTLIRKDEPVFNTPDHKHGRAHFFASEKKFFNIYFETYWFNLIIIFLTAVFLYVLLICEILKKIADFYPVYNFNSLFSQMKQYLKNTLNPILKK